MPRIILLLFMLLPLSGYAGSSRESSEEAPELKLEDSVAVQPLDFQIELDQLNTQGPSELSGMSFQEFKVALNEKVTYNCDLEGFRKNPDYQSKQDSIEFFLANVADKTLSNDEFNRFMSDLIPAVLFNGLESTFRHNPDIAKLFLKNSLKYKIEVQCSLKALSVGGVAHATRRFNFAGRRIVDIGWMILPILSYLKTGLWSPERIIAINPPRYADDIPDENFRALGFTKKDIYHEFLHHYAIPKGFGLRTHKKDTFDDGAGNDLVYACSNEAYSPDAHLRGKHFSPIKMIAISYIEVVDVRSEYSDNLNFLIRADDTILSPLTNIAHNYTFLQCITCGSAKLNDNESKIIFDRDETFMLKLSNNCKSSSINIDGDLKSFSEEIKKIDALNREFDN